MIKAQDKTKKPIKFKFCDSIALEQGDVGLSATDVAKMLDGHVEELAEVGSQ